MNGIIFLSYLTSIPLLKAEQEFWPIEFKLCATETLFRALSWYEHYGYGDDEKMYLGQSRHDVNRFGWAGHNAEKGLFNIAGNV